MKPRELARFLLLITAFLLLFPTMASADVGPKPELTVVVRNPPQGEYYLDLLVQGDASYDNLRDSRSRYDKEKLALLEAYNGGGWHPALARGTRVPLWGSLTGTREGDTVVHTFGYLGVPADYKIIVVTPDNRVAVSEEVHREAFQSRVTYDYATGRLSQQSAVLSYTAQFAATCAPTLVIEALIMMAFGFSLKSNARALLGVNLATQALLTATVGTAMLKSGPLLAFTSLVPVELLILAVEVYAFSRLLTQHTVRRRAWFAVTANLASALAGFAWIWLTSSG